MVLQRRDPEYAMSRTDPKHGAHERGASRRLEESDLDHHRHGDHHQESADDEQQQLGAGQYRQAGEGAAQREGPGVAHDDGGRRGVPP